MMLAKSLQSAAGNAAAEANYIESVFQTHLYTGNGSTQTITNGIDLAGEGGMVWAKDRSSGFNHELFDTARGTNSALISNGTFAAQTYGPYAFNANGFGYGSGYVGNANTNGVTYASWTFRKQPKFFDVVTWTGDSVGGRQISHALGSVPGCIIIKTTSTTSNWTVVHRSLPAWDYFLRLNTTDAADNAGGLTQAPTSTQFSATGYNDSGRTYVAYLFAHNAGGFGLTGEDNVISCGSYTTDGSGNATVNLGYEPQWVILKHTSTTSGWTMFDTMRGWTNSSANDPFLQANTSNAENSSVNNFGHPTATGFEITNFSGSVTGIYIAIRRGPMKVPESGTSVFTTVKASGGTGLKTTNFPVDLAISKNSYEPGVSSSNYVKDRLRGAATTANLATNATDAEFSLTSGVTGFDNQNSIFWTTNGSGYQLLSWCFRRAPGFMDVCCYTGTSTVRTVDHNLTVVPEMMIVKSRSAVTTWRVYHKDVGNNYNLLLNTSGAVSLSTAVWASTTPTASVFSVGNNSGSNTSGGTYVAYLFASCPGVSKVGSYTGTGTTQQINCGFTAGARFVLIKRTDSTGDWVLWDSSRGMVAGTDPRLALNSTAAEVNANWVYATSGGFEIVTSDATVNASGGSYIFLSIA